MPVAGLLSAPPTNHRPLVPTKEFPSPNIRPHPTMKNETEERAKTTKFFDRMLTAFLTRQKPDSTSANPAFIQNTRNAAISVHTVSAATLLLATLAESSAICAATSGCAAAGAGAAAGAAGGAS